MTDPNDQIDDDGGTEADEAQSGGAIAEPPRKLSLREQANAPSDTVGTGSYAAIACSVIAVATTAILILGLLLVRWLT